jgi:hypothetical protein
MSLVVGQPPHTHKKSGPFGCLLVSVAVEPEGLGSGYGMLQIRCRADQHIGLPVYGVKKGYSLDKVG